MDPRFSSDNPANVSLADFEFFCQYHLRFSLRVFHSYLKNLVFGQNYTGINLTPQSLRSISHNFIFNVVRISSKIQMFNSYTSRIVTFMKNMETGWNFSTMKYPRGSVRHFCALNGKPSIALGAFGSLPFIAAIKRNYFNTLPESFHGNCLS